MIKRDQYDCLIIGGGFFGLYIAEYLSHRFDNVVVLEKEPEFMTRSSYVNQARIHNGYHYPRSILTALRSRVSFPRFSEEFADCVSDEFAKYYAIGKLLTKVNAAQFMTFCQRIGAPCEPAPYRVTRLFNTHFIEAVFSTVEHAFDALKLRDIMLDRLASTQVELVCNVTVRRVHADGKGGLKVLCLNSGQEVELTAQQVFSCTYSQQNQVVTNSGLEIIPLKHELTEMALVEVPELFANLGITVMCGPFFSIMPFPPLNLHTLSHVRYTPHFEWYDARDRDYLDSHELYRLAEKRTAYQYMLKDVSRYIPLLADCKYKDSLWEVKTVLPLSEIDDSRPILFKPHYGGLSNFHCIVGGKIDNVYDVADAIGDLLLHAR
jgi:glycine/D-amino acid oxidase-like deaminating enzyme